MATIQGIYVALFGRPADPLGLKYFNDATSNGANLDAIGDLAATAEYQDRFEGMNSNQIVTAIYQSLFGRAPELGGLEFFVTALQNGTYNINNVAIAILDGAKDGDKAIVDNKIEAANAWTAAVAADPAALAAYNGDLGAQAGRAYLAPVTGDDATIPSEAALEAALNNLVDADDQPGESSTFLLTALDDLADINGSIRNAANGDGIVTPFKFTSGNELVIAASGTLTGNDQLIDASTADNDELRITLGQSTGAAVVQNIETFNVTATNSAATGNVALNLTNVSGLKTLNISGTPGAGVTVGTPNGSGVEKIDASGLTSVGGTLTVNFTAARSAAVEVIGGASNDIITGGNGADKLSGGGGNDLINGGAGADTIDGGGGSDRLIGGNGNDTINGGAGNDIISGGADNDTLNGDAGNDIIIAGSGNDTIAGGAGNDVIVLGNVQAAVLGGGDSFTYDPNDLTLAFVDADTAANNFDRAITAADFTTAPTGAASVPLSTAGANGNNVILFEATAADNGSDVVYGFNVGNAAAGGDTIDVSAYLGADVSRVALTADDGTGDNVADYNVIVANVSLANIAAGDTVTWGDSRSFVLVTTEGGNANVYYATSDANGVLASTSLVGTLDSVATANLVDFNFA